MSILSHGPLHLMYAVYLAKCKTSLGKKNQKSDKTNHKLGFLANDVTVMGEVIVQCYLSSAVYLGTA